MESSPGDAIIFDFRVLHRGTANRSGQWRPVLYKTCSRSWFTDDFNFPDYSLFETTQNQGSSGKSDDSDAASDALEQQDTLNGAAAWVNGGPGRRAGFLN
jgi:hypothetical protein